MRKWIPGNRMFYFSKWLRIAGAGIGRGEGRSRRRNMGVNKDPNKSLGQCQQWGPIWPLSRERRTPGKAPLLLSCSNLDVQSGHWLLSTRDLLTQSSGFLTSWDLITSLSTGQSGTAFNSLERKIKTEPELRADLDSSSALRPCSAPSRSPE